MQSIIQEMKKLFALPVFMIAVLVGQNGYAQQTASATAVTAVKIIKPISILNVDKMDFGNIAVGNSAAIVKLGTNNSRQVLSGDITLPSNAGTVTAASFKVKGEAGYNFTISIAPSSITLQDASATNTMTLNTFVSSLGATGQIDPTTGEVMLYVGGNLNIQANQTAGTYNSTTNLAVTVQYN